MTIPFADLFNKARARLRPAAADSMGAQPRPDPMEKPSSERLSKTVLPNTIRTLMSPDPMKVATASARGAKAASASTLPPVEASSRTAPAHSRQLPRASVLGLEPKMERTISLQLADILEQMPAGYVKSQETFDPARSSPFAWAVMITRNKAIDRLRVRQRLDKLREKVISEESFYQDKDETSANEPALRERGALIRSALHQIPEEQRQALELSFFSGLTHEQIAERLDTPLGTIKARIRRGLLRLRDCLKEGL